MYIENYQNNLNKSTYTKIKQEAKSALIIYGFSKILSKIITFICYPIIFLIFKIGHELYKISEYLIPKKIEELVDEYNSDIEQESFKFQKEALDREFKRLFIEWKGRNSNEN
jgi:hypothetical protein